MSENEFIWFCFKLLAPVAIVGGASFALFGWLISAMDHVCK